MKLINYRTNKNIMFACQFHVVFTPKYRRPVLINGIDEALKTIINQVCIETNTIIIEMEVMPDHVHLLLDVDPQFGVNTIVKRIKGTSSNILRKTYPELKSKLPCLWSNSYFCATTGGASLDVVKQYIESQKYKR